MSLAEDRPYAAVAGHWDEMALPNGEQRTHWRQLMENLDAIGREELLRRWREGRRLIEENGVTYNVYGDPRGMARPWQLDTIPLLLSSSEWRDIEAAVVQRATLLNRMLGDLYGPGRLLQEGWLPPSLVFANPGFLRPLAGIAVPESCRLQVYAADLARSPDGRWWVLADRTQAPSGAGYALENRVVMSRILPEAFRDFHVQRLASWFQTYRDTLLRQAPPGRDDPKVVLLTPGPYNETYFEHAYLARYLGFPLVEGADLTVRDERVFLRTISGLVPVDVIVRRQDDVFCDPVELFGESALGIPGLVHAVRAGHVTVANALGAGLLETAGIMAFLPGLCRHLLDEELRMPSLATWWCGEQRERSYVEANLERLVVKPTFAAPRRDVVFGDALSGADRTKLLDQIEAAPHAFVAQERLALSTAPTASESGHEPRHLVVRVYAVASNDSYVVMPGGLTRVSSTPESLVVSAQRGGGSKDTWVLADEPVPFVTLLDRVERPVDVSRATYALTSRVADNLLWLGRLSERSEAGVRLFRCALRRLAEEPLHAADAPLPDALDLLARSGWIADPEAIVGAAREDATLDALFERKRAGSLGATVGALHRLAWLLRDRISADAWRFLARTDQELTPPTGHPALRVSDTLGLLERTLMALSAFTGLVMEGMTRGEGWHFLEIGRRIERGIQMVELLRTGLVDDAPRESRRLENVLEIADSSMTYRSRYQTSVQLPLVLDLLLADEANPRSVAYQLARLVNRFELLPRAPRAAGQALLDRLRSVDLAEIAALEAGDEGEQRTGLAALLAELATGIPALAEALNHAYLSHAMPRRQPVGVRTLPRPRA